MYVPVPYNMARRRSRWYYCKVRMQKEVKTIGFWRAVVCECLGTFMYVFGGCVTSSILGPLHGGPVRAALTFGFLSATLTQCFGHISGAHLNPAVTLAVVLTNKMTLLRAFLYLVAQCGGAIAGAALIIPMRPDCCKPFGLTTLTSGVTPARGFGLELMFTFLLVFTMFATIDPCRRMLGSQPLAIGLSVFTAHLVLVDLTGCGVNPARSLGPAFIFNTWKHHWVYWIGPLLGGAAAGLLYEHIFQPRRSDALPEAASSSYSSGSQKEEYGMNTSATYQPRRILPPEQDTYTNGFSHKPSSRAAWSGSQSQAPVAVTWSDKHSPVMLPNSQSAPAIPPAWASDQSPSPVLVTWAVGPQQPSAPVTYPSTRQ